MERVDLAGSSPFLSVVIPGHRRPKAITECLMALAPGVQTGAIERYEVIVSDDSPADESLAPLIQNHFPWARWTAGPRKGPAANRNHGARQASGEWLVFVDDDCIPDRQFLAAYMAAILQAPSILVREGRTYVDRQQNTLAETAPINETGGFLWSCNFAIRRALFEEIGGFEERFRFAAMEDVELRHRLKDRSEEIEFVHEAAVCHPWRPIDPIGEVQRHRKSVEVFISIHPSFAAQFAFRRTLNITMRTMLRRTLPGIIRFRGAGFGSAMLAHAYTLYLAALYPFRTTQEKSK